MGAENADGAVLGMVAGALVKETADGAATVCGSAVKDSDDGDRKESTAVGGVV